MALSREESETCILFNAADRENVHVFSDDPVFQRKLERAGAVIKKVNPSGSKEYTLRYNQISIRKLKAKKEMTEEQRQRARERLNRMREARKHEG